MAITLPTLPRGTSVTPRLVDFGRTLRPALGGPLQRIGRIGSRYAIDVRLPPMSGSCARAFIAAQLKAKNNGDVLRLAWPQQAVSIAGAPTVNGAGQIGSTLAIFGLTGAVTVPAGAFFSVLAGSRTYLYATTDTVTATSGGAVTLQIAPMLRASPTHLGAVNFFSPTIEGFLENDVSWDLEYLRFHGIAFSLIEDR